MKTKFKLIAIASVVISLAFTQHISRKNTNPFKKTEPTKTSTEALPSGLYVDGFDLICGVTIKEDSLLNFCLTNRVNILYLYDLNTILSTDLGKTKLSAFIVKFNAKNIKGIGVYGGLTSLSKRIAYNDSRSAANQKLVGINLENEYWLSTPETTWSNWQSILTAGFTQSRTKGLKSDFYIGWLKNAQGATEAQQAEFMVANSDRALIHCYIDSTRMASTDGAFTFIQSRLSALGTAAIKANKVYKVEIIFAKTYKATAQVTITNNWFNYHSPNDALLKIKSSANKLSWTGKAGIIIDGKVLYSYSRFR